MSVPMWVAELTEIFWTRAKRSEAFPRNLRLAIESFPVTVVELLKLRVRTASDWLLANQIVCKLPGQDRDLLACLAASRGYGFVLLSLDQCENELRFSLAHEIAHFLKDYWYPRERAKCGLGTAITAVLDGERPPTPDERLHALLRSVPLGFHVHLMERDRDGRALSAAVLESEANADRLAYELLAPSKHVLAQAESDWRALATKLRSVYGLPETQATRYAQLLLPTVRSDPLILRLKAMWE